MEKWKNGTLGVVSSTLYVDSSNSSSITSKFVSSSRSNWTGIWFFDQVGHQTTNVSWK